MSNLSTLFDRYKALVVFDTETSGLDFDDDQIIELAALRVERTATGGLRIAGKMDTFIKLPEGEALPENIVSLTGITDERLQTEGVQPAKAASQIAKLMQNGPTLMIAHNAQFDACFLRGLLRGQKVGAYIPDTPAPAAETAEPTEPAARYPLTDAERDVVERVVMAEAGGESFEGQMLVAQCILNAAEKRGVEPSEAVVLYSYTKSRPDPTQRVKDAVAAVFDRGETVVDEPILYFYNPALVTSDFHESQIFVIEEGGHRFFAERSTR